MDALLTVENLTKSFGDKLLFEDISFGINAGQKTALIARNGYGKSTLLNIITGKELPDSGKVTFRGDIKMAYLPQKREVTITPVEANISGLEAVWAPLDSRRYQLTPIDEHLDVAPLASKPIVIADDPDPSMLSVLKSLAAGGHTVVVASQLEEYINLSDKIIMLGNHDTVIS